MNKINSEPPLNNLRQALGRLGDQPNSNVPSKTDYLRELAVLKGVKIPQGTEPEIAKDVIRNILENERLAETSK